MPIDILMPALSPTMEAGTLAKWLVKEGDVVKAGQVICEIETDKAAMEYETADEGTVGKLLIAAGAEGVKVGTKIAVLLEEGESAQAVTVAPVAPSRASPPSRASSPSPPPSPPEGGEGAKTVAAPSPSPQRGEGRGEGASNAARIKASPLARRLAAQAGIDLAGVAGSGPDGRIVKADLEQVPVAPPVAKAPPTAAPASVPVAAPSGDIPHEVVKLSGMRKVIARRLTEAKQTIPHIYLTLDVRLDALLKLRGELNEVLEPQGVKLSVNDMLIKALALALVRVPACNVSFAGETLLKYSRADISVAVSVPGGLITPIIVDAAAKPLSRIATEMAELAARAKAGKLQPHEYQGGTASLSNMGMMGIRQFDAVINPPQGMILAVGAGEKRPVVTGDALGIATLMTATGSFDHRAIDGADGAALMSALREIVEKPLALVA